MTGMNKSKPGISLVELVVAVGLLSLVSVAAIQLLNMTETTLITSQAKLDEQQRSDAITSYVYKDFARGRLNDAVDSQVYQNSDMPDGRAAGSGRGLMPAVYSIGLMVPRTAKSSGSIMASRDTPLTN